MHLLFLQQFLVFKSTKYLLSFTFSVVNARHDKSSELFIDLFLFSLTVQIVRLTCIRADTDRLLLLAEDRHGH